MATDNKNLYTKLFICFNFERIPKSESYNYFRFIFWYTVTYANSATHMHKWYHKMTSTPHVYKTCLHVFILKFNFSVFENTLEQKKKKKKKGKKKKENRGRGQ